MTDLALIEDGDGELRPAPTCLALNAARGEDELPTPTPYSTPVADEGVPNLVLAAPLNALVLDEAEMGLDVRRSEGLNWE